MQLPRPGPLLTFILLANTVCQGIKILESDVESPPLVHKSGSLDTLTLDCPFVREDDDLPEALSVQWYYEGYGPWIYHWIHNNIPQALGPFENRVDLEYAVSEDPIHKYRALSLLNPTTELTGVYTCSVQTFMDAAKLKRRVIIYSEPSEFKLETNQIDNSNVKVICEAEGIFPEPEVHIYKNYDGEILELNDVTEVKMWNSVENGNVGEGRYNVHAEFTTADEDLSGKTEFGCDLMIPETNITFSDTISYEPRNRIESSEVDEPESSPRNDLSGKRIETSEVDGPESSARNDLSGVGPRDAASTSRGNSRCHLAVMLIFIGALSAMLIL